MRMPFFSKAISQKPEIKSGFFQQGLFNTGSFKAPITLEPVRAIQYYKSIAPLASAINLISDECSTIDLVVQDQKTGEFLYDNDLTKMLYRPNADLTYSEFMKSLSTFYLLTGNCYFIINSTSPVAPPLEIIPINPQYITIEGNSLPVSYTYNSASTSTIFKRNETVQGGLRYYTENGKSEIIHIKNFNPDMGSRNFLGISPISSIYYELEIYANQSIHNLALLNNGARPSGILMSESPLEDTSRQYLIAQATNNYTGASNAGRMMVIDGGKMTYQSLSVTNKDMDFIELRKEVTKMIYSVLKVPLPLVSADTMTMNNYIQAQLYLYDNVVLPLIKKFGQEFEKAFFIRYQMQNGYDIFYNEQTVPALRERYQSNADRLQKTGALSINEIRILNGYNNLTEGGNEIRQPANLIPVGMAPLETSEEQESIDNEPEDELIKSYDHAIKATRNGSS